MATWPLRHAAFPDNKRQISQKEAFLLVKWSRPMNILVLVWCKLIGPLLTKIWAEDYFHIFVLSDLEWTLTFRPQICTPVTIIQFCAKLEVYTAFLLQENRRQRTDGQTDRRTDRQTDGVQHLMRHQEMVHSVIAWIEPALSQLRVQCSIGLLTVSDNSYWGRWRDESYSVTDCVDLKSKQQIEWYSSKKVEQKPASDVVDSD